MSTSWATALEQLIQSEADIVPDGWQSPSQVAQDLNKSEEHTRKQLKRMVDAGLAEMRYFRVGMRAGVRQAPHYRLKQPAASGATA